MCIKLLLKVHHQPCKRESATGRGIETQKGLAARRRKLSLDSASQRERAFPLDTHSMWRRPTSSPSLPLEVAGSLETGLSWRLECTTQVRLAGTFANSTQSIEIAFNLCASPIAFLILIFSLIYILLKQARLFSTFITSPGDTRCATEMHATQSRASPVRIIRLRFFVFRRRAFQSNRI